MGLAHDVNEGLIELLNATKEDLKDDLDLKSMANVIKPVALLYHMLKADSLSGTEISVGMITCGDFEALHEMADIYVIEQKPVLCDSCKAIIKKR